MRFISQYLQQIPIPKTSETLRKQIEKAVHLLLDAKEQARSYSELEQELNQFVYQAFDLTSEEIALIENSGA